MLFDWKSILLFIGASQGLILGIVLLFRKDSKRLFGLLLLLFTVVLIEYALFRSRNSFQNIAHLFGYRYLIKFMIGPLFFIYTLKLTQKKQLNTWRIIAHFLPALFSFFLLFSLLIKSCSEKLKIFTRFSPKEEPYYYYLISTLSLISVLSIIIYVIFSLKKIRFYKKITQEYHSNESEIWISTFYWFTAIYLIVIVGHFTAIIHRTFHFSLFNDSKIFLLLSLVHMINIIALSIIVIWQNKTVPLEVAMISKETNNLSHYLDEINSDQLKIINEIMITKKLFLEPNLTINDLAKELDKPAYLVSRIINQGFQKTFFKFVNGYRIIHAKELLKNTNLKILAVALDSGFSNKSSFHRTFKRAEGITPYNYRQNKI